MQMLQRTGPHSRYLPTRPQHQDPQSGQHLRQDRQGRYPFALNAPAELKEAARRYSNPDHTFPEKVRN